MRHLLLTIALLVATASVAYGHGFGQSLEKVVDNYIIDVGIDALDLVAGEPARFDFVLWNKDRTEAVEFTDAWVRIAPAERGIVFAGNLYRPEFGSTGMTYVFPKGGDYELTVRFQKDGEQIANEVSFLLTVLAGTESNSSSYRGVLLGGFLGLIFGIAITYYVKRKST